MDPFKSNEILISILSHLSAQELLLASGVSKDFYLATSSESLWCILLKKLWENKVYVPTRAKELSSRSSKWAYLYSILDSKRQFLRNDDLVSHTWSFRFKSTSGQDWIQVCPWNQGLAASEVMFLSSGRVLRLGNASMNELYSRLRLSWRIDKKHVSIRQNKHILDFLSLYERFEALYRGTKYLRDDDKLSLQLGDIGEVLYLKVNNAQVPTYFVERSPTGNWGFLFESCWAMYTSWPMPLKGTCPELEDDNRKITVDQQWVEVQRYNSQVMTINFDNDDE